MNITKAVGVSFNRRSEFASDHLRIKTVLEMVIQAESLSLGSSTGTPTHGEINALSESSFSGANFYQNITINGVSFGSGYVNSINTEADSTDVQRKRYTVTVTIPKEGQLNEVLPSVSPEVSKYIDSISESFTEQKTNHRRILNHTCSIKLDSPSGGEEQAKNVLNGILRNNNINSLFNINRTECYRFKNYSFDPESLSYNFQETREFVENELSDNNHIVIKQNSFQYVNGVVNAVFSVDVTGIGANKDISQRARDALDKASSFLGQSAQSVFSQYTSFIPGPHDSLKDIKINKTIVYNYNEAKCTVSVVYSNSRDIQESGFVYWEYSNEKQILADEIITSEQGTIIGGDELLSIQELSGSNKKFQNAASFFSDKCSKNAAKSRSGAPGVCINESISRGYGAGTIKYRYSFSNNASLNYSDDDGGGNPIRKIVNKENDQNELTLFSTFLIPEYKELLQKQENILPNRKVKSTTITTNSTANISDYLGNVFSPEDNKVTESISITFAPKQREFSCETTYFEILN
jgi:hypothetical protein